MNLVMYILSCRTDCYIINLAINAFRKHIVTCYIRIRNFVP